MLETTHPLFDLEQKLMDVLTDDFINYIVENDPKECPELSDFFDVSEALFDEHVTDNDVAILENSINEWYTDYSKKIFNEFSGWSVDYNEDFIRLRYEHIKGLWKRGR